MNCDWRKLIRCRDRCVSNCPKAAALRLTASNTRARPGNSKPRANAGGRKISGIRGRSAEPNPSSSSRMRGSWSVSPDLHPRRLLSPWIPAFARMTQLMNGLLANSTHPDARRSIDPGITITGQGNVPAFVPVKCAIKRPRRALLLRHPAPTRRSRDAPPALPLTTSTASPGLTVIAGRTHFVENRPGGRGHKLLGPYPRLFFHRRLYAAPGDKIGLLDKRQDMCTAPPVLHARRDAKRSASRASSVSSITTRYVRIPNPFNVFV